MNCYMLIGGESRRMQQRKFDLPFGSMTFGTRTIAVASQVFEQVIAVQRHGGPLVEVLTIHEPDHEGTAAVFGVAEALRHAAAKCFVLAIDYPMLSPEVLAELRERFEQSSAPMLVPMWGGRPQLLCAGLAPSVLPTIQQRIRQGRFDLRGLIDVTGAEMIPESELRARHSGEPLMNVNTPEELQEAQRIHEQQRLLASR